jgi:hypothetical protein
MITIMPIILGIYIILFVIRYFVIQELNSKKLLPNKRKENSITFITIKNVSKNNGEAESLQKKYNLLTASLWIVTLVVLVIVVVDNFGR